MLFTQSEVMSSNIKYSGEKNECSCINGNSVKTT